MINKQISKHPVLDFQFHVLSLRDRRNCIPTAWTVSAADLTMFTCYSSLRVECTFPPTTVQKKVTVNSTHNMCGNSKWEKYVNKIHF